MLFNNLAFFPGLPFFSKGVWQPRFCMALLARKQWTTFQEVRWSSAKGKTVRFEM